MSEKLSKNQIEQLVEGKVVTIATSLESSGGNQVTIECYIVQEPRTQK
jgi:hypothetical protein